MFVSEHYFKSGTVGAGGNSISEKNTDDDMVIMERIRQRLFRKPSEISVEEKRAALNRITGIIKGPVDLYAIREERLSRQ